MPKNAAIVSLGAAWLLAGCAGLPPSMGMGAAPSRPAAVQAAAFSTVERAFVMEAASKGMYEVEVSRLAAERALSAEVRSYAQTMVRHHSQANNELIAIIMARGITPPSSLSGDKVTKLHRLAALPRSDAFDNGYVRVVGIEDHRQAIATFEAARRDVRDPQLRDWIDRTLGTLRNHLAMAQSLASAMRG